MNEVSKTLYIPLYGKAPVSRRGIIAGSTGWAIVSRLYEFQS